jgi:hypothetical protein
MSGIILPKIRRVSATGFEPIFSDGHLDLNLPSGPFLLLGGNGLGKTTTLQTIIFALAGDAGSDVEEKPEFQWGSSYFKNRLNKPQEAEVEVEFSLSDTKITVRRRMNSKTIRGVKVDGEAWVNDSTEATKKYEDSVCAGGAYECFDDFRYLIHRLCYLGESRRSLVWDQGAQDGDQPKNLDHSACRFGFGKGNPFLRRDVFFGCLSPVNWHHPRPCPHCAASGFRL